MCHILISFVVFFCLVTTMVVNGNTGRHLVGWKGLTIPNVVPVSQLAEGRHMPITHSYITSYPPWVNLTLLHIGQSFMRQNLIQFVVGVGLGGGLTTNPDIVRVLLGIGNVTDHAASIKKYLSSALHVQYWSIVDLVRDQDKFFETLNLVHARHAKASQYTAERRLEYNKPIVATPEPGTNPYNVNLKVWNAFEQDLRNSKLLQFSRKRIIQNEPPPVHHHHPMNQFAFASLLWALVQGPIVAPEKNFIYGVTEEEFMGYLHLWALIGSGIGLEDKYNICLQPNLISAKRYFSEFFTMYVLPSLQHLEYEYKFMVEATIKALKDIIPIELLNIGVILLRICEVLLDIECPQLKRALNLRATFYKTMALGQLGEETFRFKPIKSTLNFIANGLLQTAGIRNFNFNSLIYDNFTAGLIEWDEDELRRPYPL